jgi:glycosyltransferase involved in cell wall biosynthesis
MALLWHSNSPWCGTGYGTQTAQAVERAKSDGHAIAVNSNYGLQGMRTEWNDIPIFPMGIESYSNDTVRANFAQWKQENPDLPAHVICLFDAWTMPEAMWKGVPTSVWCMVDHQPIPPKVLDVIKRPNITPIAVTKFGLEQMQRAGATDARYIPMAIDTKTYFPGATYDGKTGRQLMNFGEDAESLFVVSAINANKASGAGGIHRKSWAENILAFSIFAQDKPDVRLYLHTERYGNYGGLALDFLLKACGLVEGTHFKFVSQHAMHNGIPNEAMAALFNGTDCLLASTMGEGFGLTLLEAQAAGTVAIANNFSAQPELLGDGWLTEGQPYWDGAQLAWFNTPNIPSIVDALEQAYARGRHRSKKARKHALKYDADLVWEQYWRPYLAELAKPEPVAVAVEGFTCGKETGKPRLSIYIPAYKRPEIANLLASLAPQLTSECEVIVSDDDPSALAADMVRSTLQNAPCRVEYRHNVPRAGGPDNLHAGLTAGTGDWLWVISDDDVILPSAIADILEVINTHDVDRIILLTPQAPSNAAGVLGTAADIAKRDEGLLIAATLTTANVVRRAALDMTKAVEKKATLYGLAWAFAGCKRIMVMAAPAFIVGDQRAGEFVSQSDPTVDIGRVWSELLTEGLGVEVSPNSFAWNFVSMSHKAA